MSRQLNNSIPTEVLSATATVTAPNTRRIPQTSPAPSANLEPAVQKALPHLEAGQYEKALSVLAAGACTPQVQNARGVCLLRLGRYEDAVRLYRGLVLHAGGAWCKADIPTLFKTNFATALLLQGHASGCYSILGELDNESHPTVIRLRGAIKKWQATLNFSQRLNWWFGRIDPPNCHVSIDFLPGEIMEEQNDTDHRGVLPLGAHPPTVV